MSEYLQPVRHNVTRKQLSAGDLFVCHGNLFVEATSDWYYNPTGTNWLIDVKDTGTGEAATLSEFDMKSDHTVFSYVPILNPYIFQALPV